MEGRMGFGSVKVVGAGLAGSEAAYQVAKRGGAVHLYEMRPRIKTPAHKTALFAELVCSNSLKSEDIENASGLLKKELRILGSLIMRCAERSRVPSGMSLSVDRKLFGMHISDRILSNPMIQLIPEEVRDIGDETTVIATGPLTSDALSKSLRGLLGEEYFYFYDATSPIVDAETIDTSQGFWGSRYGKGGPDYFNIPLDEGLYKRFVEELLRAEKHEEKPFENLKNFEGCKPIEDLAERGIDTLRFGPMKPVGLKDPKTRKEPYAVIQLRKENTSGTMLSMVGFQTRLKWKEQERVFRMIPALKNAVFLRFGYLHRNSFINSPKHLNEYLQLREKPNVFLGGQITGCEGYLESTALGLIAGINAIRFERGLPLVTPPETTMTGSLIRYIVTSPEKEFQPINANFGLLPPLEKRVKKREKRVLLAKRAIKSMEDWIKNLEGRA